jgi:hypothetical protein
VAGKTVNEADKNFAYFFRQSLSVVTNKQLVAGRDGDDRLLLYEPPVTLQRKNGAPLCMAITQTYRIVPTETGYKAKSTSYIYGVSLECDGAPQQIFDFHWHPLRTPRLQWPHLHVRAEGPDGNLGHAHFPTARLAIEDFLRSLIRDFGVKPKLPYLEWKEILTRNKREFVESATWLSWKPL